MTGEKSFLEGVQEVCVGEGLDRGGLGGREWGKEAVAVKPSAFARTMKLVLALLKPGIFGSCTAFFHAATILTGRW